MGGFSASVAFSWALRLVIGFMRLLQLWLCAPSALPAPPGQWLFGFVFLVAFLAFPSWFLALASRNPAAAPLLSGFACRDKNAPPN